MILTTNILRSYGFRIDAGIQDAQLQRAVDEAEQGFAVRYFGQEHYQHLLTLEANDPIIAGGTIPTHDGGSAIIAGYMKAVAYIAYACLLRHNINATTFGSVRKKDEHSDNVDPWEVARYFESYGRGWFVELAEALGWRPEQTGSYYTESASL